MLKFFRKGQSTSEYVIMISLVVAAAVGMQLFVKRGLQGKMRDAVYNNLTSAIALEADKQYEPYYLASDFDTITESDETVSEATGGSTTKAITQIYTSRSGEQNYTAPITEP